MVTFRAAASCSLCCLLATGGAAAQDPGVAIVRTTVRAVVEAGAATTTIEQVFGNRGEQPAEATWLLPLPEGACADGLTLSLGDKELGAEVLDAAAARSVYEAIVRRRRDPALLEYVGQGLLRARVFPIPPHGEAALRVRLRQAVPTSAGLAEWSLPLRALRTACPSVGPIGVDVTLHAPAALKTVFPSRADAEVQWQDECRARVTCEIAPAAAVERELRILFGLADAEFGLHAVTYRRPGEAGWFVLFVSPRRELPASERPPRCVQFVIDTSGSMRGKKMRRAKAAMRAFLATLQPQDLFQIVPFATEARPFYAAPRRAEPAALIDAQLRIDALEARGGTNIEGALASALVGITAVAEPGMLSQVVFVTDGQPTVGLTDPRRLAAGIAAQNRERTRLFVLGVGDDVSRDLLDDLARDSRGSRAFAADDGAIDRQIAALCARIAQPALTDVVVTCDGIDGFEVEPRAVPDLFAGDTMQLVGRYRGTGRGEIVLRGVLGGEPMEYRFGVDFPAVDQRHDFVPVSWAQRQIDELLAQIRRVGRSKELLDEVGRLAREFGITTPYTSQLIVEEGLRLAGGTRGPCGPSRGAVISGPGGPAPGGGGGVDRGPGGPGAASSGSWRSGGSVNGGRGVALDDDGGPGVRQSAAANVRRAAGRTFLRAGSLWIESGLPTDWQQQAHRVAAFGDDYFALLRAHPEIAEALALGSDVALRVGDEIVRIAAE